MANRLLPTRGSKQKRDGLYGEVPEYSPLNGKNVGC